MGPKGEAIAFLIFIILYSILSAIASPLIFWILRSTPLWVFGCIQIGAVINLVYFFCGYPVSAELSWNLSLRQLYPYRQYRIERRMMGQLQRWRLAPRRDPLRLPPELWAMILAYASPVPITFHTTCNPEDFEEFIDHLQATSLIYLPTGFDSQTLLLMSVCKVWSVLIRKNAKFYTQIVGSDFAHIPFDADRAHISTIDTSSNNTDPPEIHSYTTPSSGIKSAAHRLSILQLTTSVSKWATDEELQRISHQLNVLFKHGTRLKSIRFLQYSGGSHLYPPTLFDELQHSFSHLTTLAISAEKINGGLRLEKLKNLYVRASEWDLSEWWFPSLRQIAFGSHRIARFYYHSSVIPAPSNNIESLLLPDYHSLIEADATFWADHPSLLFLGVDSSHFTITSIPPSSHPLAYLHFKDARWNINRFDFAHVSATLNSIPNLKKVLMPRPSGDEFKPMYPGEWPQLLRSQQSRGIAWYARPKKRNKIRTEVHYREPKENRDLRQWEAVMVGLWGAAMVILALFQLWRGTYSEQMLSDVWIWAFWSCGLIFGWIVLRGYAFRAVKPWVSG